MSNVIDMAEARKRRDSKQIGAQIKKFDIEKAKRVASNKLAEALAKYGHLNGIKSLERMKKLFKKVDEND